MGIDIMSPDVKATFRIAAGLLAIATGLLGAWKIALMFSDSSSWYFWAFCGFAQLFLASAFGAYALARRGPYEWIRQTISKK